MYSTKSKHHATPLKGAAVAFCKFKLLARKVVHRLFNTTTTCGQLKESNNNNVCQSTLSSEIAENEANERLQEAAAEIPRVFCVETCAGFFYWDANMLPQPDADMDLNYENCDHNDDGDTLIHSCKI